MKTQPSSLPSFSGIIGACLTPFHEDGQINYEALQKEIDFIIEDADAISIAAVEAAEYTMLSVQERKELMKTATEMVEKRIPVILGAGALKGWELYRAEDPQLTSEALLAAGMALVAALIAIAAMMAWLRRATFTPFVVYRLCLGALMLAVIYG